MNCLHFPVGLKYSEKAPASASAFDVFTLFCEVSRQCWEVKQRLRRREVLCLAQCEVKRATHDKQALHDAKHHFTHEVRFLCRKARFVQKKATFVNMTNVTFLWQWGTKKMDFRL